LIFLINDINNTVEIVYNVFRDAGVPGKLRNLSEVCQTVASNTVLSEVTRRICFIILDEVI